MGHIWDTYGSYMTHICHTHGAYVTKHVFDISWFKWQSLTLMILQHRFNSYREFFYRNHGGAPGFW